MLRDRDSAVEVSKLLQLVGHSKPITDINYEGFLALHKSTDSSTSCCFDMGKTDTESCKGAQRLSVKRRIN